MYVSNAIPYINDKSINNANNKTDNLPTGNSSFFFALKTYASSMFAPIVESNKSNKTNFKRIKDKTGKKEEKTRTVYDVIGEIAAIERKMGQGN